MGSLWASYFDPSSNLHFIQRQAIHPAIYEFNVEPYNLLIKGDCVTPEEIQTSIKYLIVATKAYDAALCFLTSFLFLALSFLSSSLLIASMSWPTVPMILFICFCTIFLFLAYDLFTDIW